MVLSIFFHSVQMRLFIFFGITGLCLTILLSSLAEQFLIDFLKSGNLVHWKFHHSPGNLLVPFLVHSP